MFDNGDIGQCDTSVSMSAENVTGRRILLNLDKILIVIIIVRFGPAGL